MDAKVIAWRFPLIPVVSIRVESSLLRATQLKEVKGSSRHAGEAALSLYRAPNRCHNLGTL